MLGKREGLVTHGINGDPPFGPGGCMAQARSVAELLRGWQATRG